MALKKKLAAAAFGVLALGGIGAGVANAATTQTTPQPPAAGAPTADALTPGDTADAPGAVDAPEAGGAAETPEAGAVPGAPDTDNVQQGGGAQSGDQTGPDVAGTAPGA